MRVASGAASSIDEFVGHTAPGSFDCCLQSKQLKEQAVTLQMEPAESQATQAVMDKIRAVPSSQIRDVYSLEEVINIPVMHSPGTKLQRCLLTEDLGTPPTACVAPLSPAAAGSSGVTQADAVETLAQKLELAQGLLSDEDGNLETRLLQQYGSIRGLWMPSCLRQEVRRTVSSGSSGH